MEKIAVEVQRKTSKSGPEFNVEHSGDCKRYAGLWDDPKYHYELPASRTNCKDECHKKQ